LHVERHRLGRVHDLSQDSATLRAMVARVNIDVFGLGPHAEDALALFEFAEGTHQLGYGRRRGLWVLAGCEGSFLHDTELHVNRSAAASVAPVGVGCAFGGQCASCWDGILHRGFYGTNHHRSQ
jgi:hypothetical protein